jgi:hypothetical protein
VAIKKWPPGQWYRPCATLIISVSGQRWWRGELLTRRGRALAPPLNEGAEKRRTTKMAMIKNKGIKG